MISHGRGVFERAAILEVGGDPGRPEAVVADLGLDPGHCGAPTDHRIGVGLGQGGAGQLPRPVDRAKQGLLAVVGDAGAVQVGG